MHSFRLNKQLGATLLEVLIAVVVLSIGLLGVVALQTSALRNNQSSMERSMAVVQSYSIFEAMRANVANARQGGYDTGGNVCAIPAAGATLATKDIKRWISDIQEALNDSAACGNIACVASPAPNPTRVCTVTVTWNDSRGGVLTAGGTTTGNAAQAFTTTGRI